ncbi:glycoside hydrolase family 13 domain protein [Elusimicrobium minutum Pei191]|uniref:Glycoside hydrolase family 13 domain protein n=1 Tax=Elusimicrobium minutum (strain Pei191) TaxID=445932 RepID=B2KDW4_ELUMP|nr:family 1 glycoside hydrolase [Elusimicrobium minutum]ACC98710.1 glycoside hydrolase family 13 domain protein [Elusimicrobium minutum Pei191]
MTKTNNNKQEKKENQKSKDNIIPMVLSLLMLSFCLFLLLSAVQNYYSGLKTQRNKPVEISKSKKTPKPLAFDTEIKFRKFFITAPNAKEVRLLADFNEFGKTPIILTPYKKGYFDTSVALAAGEYKYVFLVDGKEVLDPLNKDIIEYEGREVCVKTVR